MKTQRKPPDIRNWVAKHGQSTGAGAHASRYHASRCIRGGKHKGLHRDNDQAFSLFCV